MRTLLSILLFIALSPAFGQSKVESEAKILSFHWITEKCNDLTDLKNNDICVQKELENYITEKINWEIRGTYMVRISISNDIDGKIIDVKAKHNNKELNREFEKVLMAFPYKLKTVDQNGKVYSNSMTFSFTLYVD